MEPTKLVFEEALEIVRCEVKLGRTFPTQESDAECTAAPVPAKHTEAAPVTPKTGIFITTLETTFSEVRKHSNGRDQFRHSVEQP